MTRWLLPLLYVAIIWRLASPKAQAILAFQKEFHGMYVEKNKNEAFTKAVKKAKCHVCHIGKNRKQRNAYGDELARLLDRKKDKRNKKKIREALQLVARVPTDPKHKGSPTYGELIKAGILPGGETGSRGKEQAK